MSKQPLEAKVLVKVVRSNGRIYLGEEFAGRHVLVEESEPGVWLIKVIPEKELWIHQPGANKDLQRAIRLSRPFLGKSAEFRQDRAQTRNK